MAAFNGDQFFEILSWLPANTIHNFAPTSKKFLELISDPSFVKTQCHRSMLKTEDSFFVDELGSFLFSEALSQPATVGLPQQSLSFIADQKSRILASRNGLLVCGRINYDTNASEFVLCNPTTRTWLPISFPDSCTKYTQRYNWDIGVFLCFGDTKSFPLDYSLLVFELDSSCDWSNNTYKVHVFEHGHWNVKTIDIHSGGRSLAFERPVQSKNNILFMSDCSDYLTPQSSSYWPYIISYDLKQGTSTKITVPREAWHCGRTHKMQIFGWEACKENSSCFKSLCLVTSDFAEFSAWVLKDTDDPNSWQKLIDGVNMKDDLRIKCTFYWSPSCIVMGKRLVFAGDNNVYSYGLDGEERGDIKVICENKIGRSSVRFNSYCSTLRPCQKDYVSTPQFIS